jgi:hypothetical protein
MARVTAKRPHRAHLESADEVFGAISRRLRGATNMPSSDPSFAAEASNP